MDKKFISKSKNKSIDDFIKLYNSNNFSLNIFKKKIKNSYFLFIEIKPFDCSKSEAIKKKKIRLHIIKYDGINIPESKLCKCLNRVLKKCKKGKMSNNLPQQLYLKLKFPYTYKKYYKFDETIIVIIIIIILFIFGVIWSSYHNIITDYILNH